MKIRNFMLVLGAALVLTACVVDRYPHRTGIYVPGIVIDDGHHGHHCPPGQHKKGRC